MWMAPNQNIMNFANLQIVKSNIYSKSFRRKLACIYVTTYLLGMISSIWWTVYQLNTYTRTAAASAVAWLIKSFDG